MSGLFRDVVRTWFEHPVLISLASLLWFAPAFFIEYLTGGLTPVTLALSGPFAAAAARLVAIGIERRPALRDVPAAFWETGLQGLVLGLVAATIATTTAGMWSQAITHPAVWLVPALAQTAFFLAAFGIGLYAFGRISTRAEPLRRSIAEALRRVRGRPGVVVRTGALATVVTLFLITVPAAAALLYMGVLSVVAVRAFEWVERVYEESRPAHTRDTPGDRRRL